jgi:hypothetical protein
MADGDFEKPKAGGGEKTFSLLLLIYVFRIIAFPPD